MINVCSPRHLHSSDKSVYEKLHAMNKYAEASSFVDNKLEIYIISPMCQ